jgi:RNA methyltransferase, TrmH family
MDYGLLLDIALFLYPMTNAKHISSPQNPLIKMVVLLKEKSRERKKTGRFVLEGRRELYLALSAKYSIETLFYCAELLSDNELGALGDRALGELIAVSPEVYAKLAHRNTTEGIVAVAKAKDHQLDQLNIKSTNPLILVAEAPEKPGNIGALLRTADAANVDAVIIANPKTDLYNPNIIRSSVGCVFTRQIAMAPTSEIIAFLKRSEIGLYCAALQASHNYLQEDFTGPTALVVGTEDKGLGAEWLGASQKEHRHSHGRTDRFLECFRIGRNTYL